MIFSLSTVRSGDGTPLAIVEVAGEYYRLDMLAPDLGAGAHSSSLMNLFEDWPRAFARLKELSDTIASYGHARLHHPPEHADYMTPLIYPSKLILGGANYYEHMFKDANKPDFRKADSTPVFFLKPPTTCLVGCGKTVRFPSQSTELDWEIELAAVIGSRLHRADEAEALAGVAGYCVGLDLSARDWQFNAKHPWRFDLFTGKAFDTSCPLGPKIVPAAFVDPSNLRLRLWVNGDLKQDANSNDMIWSVGEQVSLLSEHVTLEPGDVLLTGTPAGVGQSTGSYLKTGDFVRAEIDGLGALEIEIIPGTSSRRTPRPG